MPKVKVPQFKTDTFNIVDYGAINDGLTNNTQAIAKAIDACSANGGGTVLIPSGIWLTGPIVFKSNVNLHAAYGAFIQFSDNFDEYPLVKTSYEGLDAVRCQSPLSGKNLENVAITGEGVFDGAGDSWRGVNVWAVTKNHWKKIACKRR